MAKKKLINAVYNGVFDGMDTNQAQSLLEHALGKYQDTLDEFDRLYKLYDKPNTSGPYDKNIVFELIESEIDNNIYFPKVRSLNGRIEPAKALEEILKSELYDYKYREYNDLQERNTYIFGRAVTLVYWDALSRNSAQGGKLKFKAIDPRNFIP